MKLRNSHLQNANRNDYENGDVCNNTHQSKKNKQNLKANKNESIINLHKQLFFYKQIKKIEKGHNCNSNVKRKK